MFCYAPVDGWHVQSHELATPDGKIRNPGENESPTYAGYHGNSRSAGYKLSGTFASVLPSDTQYPHVSDDDQENRDKGENNPGRVLELLPMFPPH